MECQLVQCSANYVPLTPINFLERAAHVYGDKTAILYGTAVKYSWRETYQACLKLASALAQLQISRQDIVVALAPSIPALYMLHFAVPMAGAVLSALDTTLDASTIAPILEQLKATIMFVDYQFVEVVLKALDILSEKSVKPPLLVIIPECDPATSSMATNLPAGSLDYNHLVEKGRDDFDIVQPNNEHDPILVNYISVSMGHPKEVVYSHRATYLCSLAQMLCCGMREKPVFLWTLDTFECNGWCYTWAIAALGGTNICLRTVSAKIVFDSIHLHKVTHLCGAPTILNAIADAPASDQKPLQHKVNIVIAGALAAARILEKVAKIGFDIGHGKEITEVLGTAIVRPGSPLTEHENSPGLPTNGGIGGDYHGTPAYFHNFQTQPITNATGNTHHDHEINSDDAMVNHSVREGLGPQDHISSLPTPPPSQTQKPRKSFRKKASSIFKMLLAPCLSVGAAFFESSVLE